MTPSAARLGFDEIEPAFDSAQPLFDPIQSAIDASNIDMQMCHVHGKMRYLAF
jgi:hypothetical protein